MLMTSRTQARRLTMLTLALTNALLLTACSGTGGTDHSGGSGGSSSPGQPGDVNDTDVTFVQMMIPHHEQGVEMAKDADTKSADPRVKEVAAQIKALQTSEIKQMTGWLRAWGKPVLPRGLDHSGHAMPGMMSAQDMEKLRQAKGTTYDKLFLQLMIPHHEGAIAMGKNEQVRGKNQDVKALARWLETNQTTEITRMKQILAS